MKSRLLIVLSLALALSGCETNTKSALVVDKASWNGKILVRMNYQQPFRSIPGAGSMLGITNRAGAVRAFVDGEDLGAIPFDKTIELKAPSKVGRFDVRLRAMLATDSSNASSTSNLLEVNKRADALPLMIHCQLGWRNPDRLDCQLVNELEP